MTQKRTQLSVLAVAALAIVALVGVALLASGGAPAHATATIIAPGVEGNSMPQQQTPATPEACPGDESRPNEQAARVVDSGHIALFDVWWNPEELELTNSSCPPTVEHVPGEDGGFGNVTPARDDRSPSSINIDETIIHIPSSAKVTLNESDYPKSKYQAVWDADDAENPNGDGDRIVWVLQACPPNGSPPAGGLCISYSAALLDPAYWVGDIEYLVGHVHHVDIDKQDPGYMLVYDLPDGEGGRADLRWDSSNAIFDQVAVSPGEYDRPMWFFTSRGAYEFQVHIRGNPNTTRDDPRSKDDSVTSAAQRYTLHVGPLTLDEQPVFQVERSVAENSASDTPVGPPVKVAGIGGDALDYRLAGDGSENFAVNAAAHGAQIVVASGAALDFETRPSYELMLRVSDGKMITGAPDPSVDSVIAVWVGLTDDPSDNPAITLSADTTTPTVGEVVTLTAILLNLPTGAADVGFTWAEHDVAGTGLWTSTTSDNPVWTASHDAAGLRRYGVTVGYDDAQGNRVILHSEPFEVTWVSP